MSSLSEPIDLMATDDEATGQESNKTKERRIAQACESCRKKKTKCDGNLPVCTPCVKQGHECTFREIEKKRRNRTKGRRHTEHLEKRLAMMESLLESSGLLSTLGDKNMMMEQTYSDPPLDAERTLEVEEPDSKRASLPLSALQSPAHEASVSSTSRQDPLPRSLNATESRSEKCSTKDEMELLSDGMDSLMTNSWGETKYIGPSSGFSILSSKGSKWASESTGNSSVQDVISLVAAEDDRFHCLELEVFADLFQRKIYEPLPLRKQCFEMLQDFFENFNSVLPLFCQSTFMQLAQRQYSLDPNVGHGWWASLNVVLAIAHRLRLTRSSNPGEEYRKSQGYLKNAMAVLTELLLKPPDLLSVQALLGMSLCMNCSSDLQPSYVLPATAIRLSQSIGLHKRSSGLEFEPIEAEQRKRVFWIAYMLDREVSLRTGRCPAQDDEDINIDFPSLEANDNAGIISFADTRINIFNLMLQLALIQSKIYKQLYSAGAANQSVEKLLQIVSELDNQLEHWKSSIPIVAQPKLGTEPSQPLILHVAILHFAYFNCLATIHRLPGFSVRQVSGHVMQDRESQIRSSKVFKSREICAGAARASIYLLRYIPPQDPSCIWFVLYYPMSSVLVLFSNILKYLQDDNSSRDIDTIGRVIEFLGVIRPKDGEHTVKQMVNLCTELLKIARDVLKRSGKQTPARPHKPADVTDFRSLNFQSASGINPLGTGTDRQMGFTGPSTVNGTESLMPHLNRSGLSQNPDIDMENMHNIASIGVPENMVPFDMFQQILMPQGSWSVPMLEGWDPSEIMGEDYFYEAGQPSNDHLGTDQG